MTAPLTDYEKYIRTEELLALQKPAAELSCHDELQFQVVHQVAELWMKLIDHEMTQARTLMREDQPVRAAATVRRVVGIQRLLVDQMATLDTMAPRNYMRIREVLGRGSGQESPGFKRMLQVPREVWNDFAALLGRAQVTLRELHEQPDARPELFGLAEALIDYDQNLQFWRHRHLLLVYRIIGVGTPSLKGKHSELLEKGMREQFFPELWTVRDEVFGEWTRQMEARGEAKGYHG
jgi:tryptophan 2,3-dioxygenase